MNGLAPAHTARPPTYGHSCRFTDKFTGKKVITPDSEEGGVITAQFTDPIRGLKYAL